MSPIPEDVSDLTKLRLDYAWRYFDSASRQRMLFINYFLLSVGVLANAYVVAIKEQFYLVALYVCVFGFGSSIAFMLLDYRMTVFAVRALRILETLERQVLFPDGMVRLGPAGPTSEQLGLARTEPDHAAHRDLETGYFLTMVWFWIRFVIQGSAAVGFLLGLLYALSLRAGPPG